MNLNEMKATEEEMDALSSQGEHSPTSKTLDAEGQKSVLDAIANAEVIPSEPEEEDEGRLFDCVEVCPHCDREFGYSIPENRHITYCPQCKKAIPSCDKCVDHDKCSNCIYCDMANFINYQMGLIPLNKFLASMNPPLTDMTTSSNPLFVPSYDGFINELGGDTVNWDYKYWGIVNSITNAPVSPDSSEKEILKFVEQLVSKNRE